MGLHGDMQVTKLLRRPLLRIPIRRLAIYLGLYFGTPYVCQAGSKGTKVGELRDPDCRFQLCYCFCVVALCVRI